MRSNSPLHKTELGAMAYEHSFDARPSQRLRAGSAAVPPGVGHPSQGPELASLSPAASRIEHGCSCLIGEQLGGRWQMLQQAFVQGTQEPGGPPDPVGQRRAVELDALPSIDLGWAVD
jgi:hypothetical protein